MSTCVFTCVFHTYNLTVIHYTCLLCTNPTVFLKENNYYKSKHDNVKTEILFILYWIIEERFIFGWGDYRYNVYTINSLSICNLVPVKPLGSFPIDTTILKSWGVVLLETWPSVPPQGETDRGLGVNLLRREVRLRVLGWDVLLPELNLVNRVQTTSTRRGVPETRLILYETKGEGKHSLQWTRYTSNCRLHQPEFYNSPLRSSRPVGSS